MTPPIYSRVFWESGFRSVGAIANADPKELVPVLMQVGVPFVLARDATTLLTLFSRHNRIRFV